MPSLSKTVSANGWLTVSAWMISLGFVNLITIVAPAAAQPDARPSRASAPSTTESPEAEIPLQPVSSYQPSSSEVFTLAAQPAESSRPGSNSGSNNSALPTTAVTISSEQCLADCNPSERFVFKPPYPDVAIPPRSVYPRPDVAQFPSQSYPSQPARPDFAQTPIPVPTAPATSGRTTGDVVPPSPNSTAPVPGLTTSPPPLSSPNQTNSTTARNQVPQATTAPVPGLTTSPPPLSSPNQSTSPNQAPITPATPTAAGRPLTPPSVHLQGVYVFQAGRGSARVRATAVYPILPELQVGGSLDFTDGPLFSESGDTGLGINELYVVVSPPNYPNLRLIVGQVDLTSYFDRNSFAKDAATQFFNPVFSTNPALSAAGLGSRQAAVLNWTITDNLEAKVAAFSSRRSISAFSINGFAGELGVRLGNLIVRGTYVTGEDAYTNTGFEESFKLARGGGSFGLRPGDRENGYGINAEYFIPEINLGLFARYGWYENVTLGRGGTTYSFGVNLLDLFLRDDRLGIAYGRLLSNGDLREGKTPDVLEAFYDIRVLPWLRLGVTLQQRNQFSETVGGFRIRTDFDLVAPRRSR